MSTQPLLHGIRVLDLTRVLAGPYCTQLLGDLGADIIKVEAPGRGDDTRHWGPPFTASGQAAYFLSANRNKRSLTLNLKSDKGQQILRELIKQADVLVENFRTGTLDKWGLDYNSLQQLRPGLIYCSITGYGHTGPYKDRAGYDFMVQAMGGFMDITGTEESGPTRAGVAISDLGTGMFACQAILAALFARERTGEGQCIDMALLDSQVALIAYVASNYLVSGDLPQRLGNGHPNIVPYQTFKARDGHFAFGAGNDGQWAKFCQAIDKPEWITDGRFRTNADRVTNRAIVIPLLDEVFAQRDSADWMLLFDQIGIPSAPINNIEQVFNDPHVQARGLQTVAQRPDGETIPLVRSPLHIPTNPSQIRYPPPLLSEHSEEILGELLGYTAETVAQLREEKVV
jgi:crotonobetainyl-CoA:carnitine CoA-transferase CaiB-like acyl-CoA transferase